MDTRSGEVYNQEQVTAIIRRALLMHDPQDCIGQDDLEEIARQSGISRGRLQRAIAAEQAEGQLEAAKQELQTRKRQEFTGHFRSYLIVNAALVLLNLFTTSYLWSLWVVFSWGIGLAFHASGVFFISEYQLEQQARIYLRNKEKKSWCANSEAF